MPARVLAALLQGLFSPSTLLRYTESLIVRSLLHYRRVRLYLCILGILQKCFLATATGLLDSSPNPMVQ